MRWNGLTNIHGPVINYGEGGYKMGKFVGANLLKRGYSLCPPNPFSMAKT